MNVAAEHLCAHMKIKHTALPWDEGSQEALRSQLAGWFRAQGRDLPWRRTRDPYAIMVSEFMLQQTQVATVIDFFNRWMLRFPSFEALAAAHEAEVLHAWQGLGYYSRARNLHRAAQRVVLDYAGRLPADVALMGHLPGVGRYTAGAIGSFAFDLATPAVDANIARVLARLLDLQEPVDTVRGQQALWSAAEALLPKRRGREHTSALMELGALVCLPLRPRCEQCPVRAFCTAKTPELLPRKKPRRKAIPMLERCGWIVEDDAILLELQTGSRWRGLWKLPALAEGHQGELLLETTYAFTHHRVTLQVYTSAPPREVAGGRRWFAKEELADAAFASAHARALRVLADQTGFTLPGFRGASS
jgi:A/G-specific adenine glycosylase